MKKFKFSINQQRIAAMITALVVGLGNIEGFISFLERISSNAPFSTNVFSVYAAISQWVLPILLIYLVYELFTLKAKTKDDHAAATRVIEEIDEDVIALIMSTRQILISHFKTNVEFYYSNRGFKFTEVEREKSYLEKNYQMAKENLIKRLMDLNYEKVHATKIVERIYLNDEHYSNKPQVPE